jgi:hypothetical protein
MPLPRSSRQRLCHRVVCLAALTIASVAIPVCAQTTQQLSSSPTSVVFGGLKLGQTASEELVLTNNGQSSLAISAFSLSGSEFSITGLSLPATLNPGESTTLEISFSPTATGWVYDDVVFTSNASNSSLKIPLAGAGGKFVRLTANPSSVSFGDVAIGSSKSVPIVMTNDLSSDVTLTAIRDFGPGFSGSGLTWPMTLKPGQSATLSISFAPQNAGETAGSVLIEGGALNVPLTGTGTTIGQLAVSPSSGLSFGNVDVGSTSTQSATLTAIGGTVTLSSASSNNSQFAISGISFPLTLTTGQNTDFQVTYSPTNSGSVTGTLTVVSNASNSQASESVSGTGVVPQYSVSLSWNPSTSSVSGYNVYRGTTVGSYSKINSTLDSGTTYTDNSVVSGATYYYAATAVSSGGQESTYSAPIKISIP